MNDEILSQNHREREDYLLRLTATLTTTELDTLCSAGRAMLKMRDQWVPEPRKVLPLLDATLTEVEVQS